MLRDRLKSGLLMGLAMLAAVFWLPQVAVPLVLLAGPATYRLHLLPLDAAMWGLSKLAFWLAAGAALASVAVIVIHGRHPPHRGVIVGVVVLTFALLAPPVGLRPPYAASSAKTAPSINHPTSQQGGPFCAPIGGPD